MVGVKRSVRIIAKKSIIGKCKRNYHKTCETRISHRGNNFYTFETAKLKGTKLLTGFSSSFFFVNEPNVASTSS